MQSRGYVYHGSYAIIDKTQSYMLVEVILYEEHEWLESQFQSRLNDSFSLSGSMARQLHRK